MDDKAYLRCGTSEGFSRPIHTPVQISQENLQFKLPASDYPQECGYVSPGVILLVNNMNEVSYKNTDRYVRDNVTVTVTCKPKLVYPSTATNWFNDLYRVRYLFPQEHELEKTVVNEQNDDPQHSKEPTIEIHQYDDQISDAKQSNNETNDFQQANDQSNEAQKPEYTTSSRFVALITLCTKACALCCACFYLAIILQIIMLFIETLIFSLLFVAS